MRPSRGIQTWHFRQMWKHRKRVPAGLDPTGEEAETGKKVILLCLCTWFFFRSHSGGRNHSARRPLLAYCTYPGWLWAWRFLWNEDWQGKPKYSKKTCSSTTLSTTNPNWPDPDSNSDRRSGKSVTNRLSYAAAYTYSLFSCELLYRVFA
jgi:hypothetical protein